MKSIFIAMIKKESLHLVRDTRTLIMVIAIPILLLLLFGFAISTEVNDVKVGISIDKHTEATRDIVTRLRENPYITMVGEIVPSDVENILRRGEADAVLIIRYDGDVMKRQTVVDASNTNSAQMYAAYVEGVVNESTDSPVITRTLYNPQLKSSYNFVPGIMGMIFLLICAMMTSISIVGEKERGTMNLLLVSPVRPRIVIFGKLVPYFILSCTILAIMLALSYTVLGIPFSGNIIDIIIVSMLYVMLSLGFGLLISAVAKTQFVAMLVSGMLLMLPVLLLSGMLFPIDNMPVVLQWISCIIPARWYITAMRTLMIQQLPLYSVLTEIWILCLMTVVVFAMAIKKFNSR